MYRFDLRHIEKYQDLEELIKVFLIPDEYVLETAGGTVKPKTAKDAGAPITTTFIDIDVPKEAADKNAVKRAIYEQLAEITGHRPEWGIMTGVRPVKLVGESLRAQPSGISEEAAYANVYGLLKKTYLLTDEKAKELLDIYRYQQDTVGEAPKDTVGVYLGIPFCPTRCLYCSFPSNQVPPEEIERYLTALSEEIRYVGSLMGRMGVTAESLYFGGGTPTTLTASQLERVLTLVAEKIPAEGLREFTLEAGRPDTIDREKLRIAKEGGVDRLSINPQTMQDRTLELIGRAHNVADIHRAFEDAHAVGMKEINCDLIAGLPDEMPGDFADSMTKVLALSPTNITVHTLAVKRGSRLKDADDHYHYKYGPRVHEMLEYARRTLGEEGFVPYYLYRQKHMAGAGENTGYCKPYSEGVYNIRIMDEHQAIIAMGAGGISKSYYPAENRLERAANVTNYEHYIARIEEMCERKEKLYQDWL